MMPTAHLAHHAPGRIRIRIPSRRHDGDYFGHVNENLKSLAGALSVITNELTASILIQHTAEFALDTLANYAVKEGLFELAPEAAVVEPVLITESVAQFFKETDRSLLKWSEGRVDLRSVAFLGLVGLGIFQISRGRVLPAAISLFDDARAALKF